MRASIVPAAVFPEPTVRELCARPDAEETFERIARELPADHPEPELTATLTALAVLRARQASERKGRGGA